MTYLRTNKLVYPPAFTRVLVGVIKHRDPDPVKMQRKGDNGMLIRK